MIIPLLLNPLPSFDSPPAPDPEAVFDSTGISPASFLAGRTWTFLLCPDDECMKWVAFTNLICVGLPDLRSWLIPSYLEGPFFCCGDPETIPLFHYTRWARLLFGTLPQKVKKGSFLPRFLRDSISEAFFLLVSRSPSVCVITTLPSTRRKRCSPFFR